MVTLQKIQEIRALATTARAAIYNEDAMTALELAGVTACKVNQCIDAINGMLDIIEQVEVEARGISYDGGDEAVIM